jgi:hypothetical protein
MSGAGSGRLFGSKALGAYAPAGNALFPAPISCLQLYPAFPELPAQKPPTTSPVNRDSPAHARKSGVWQSRRVEAQRRRTSLMHASFLIVRLVRHSFLATAEANLPCHSLDDGGEAIPAFKFHWHHGCYGWRRTFNSGALVGSRSSIAIE